VVVRSYQTIKFLSFEEQQKAFDTKKKKKSKKEIADFVMKQLRRCLFLHCYCFIEMFYSCCRYVDWLGFRAYCLLEQEILEQQNVNQVINHRRDPFLLARFYEIKDFHWFDLAFSALGMILSVPMIFFSAICTFFGTAAGLISDIELMEYVATKAEAILTDIRTFIFQNETKQDQEAFQRGYLEITHFAEGPTAATAA
jgi:hypothetical protein